MNIVIDALLFSRSKFFEIYELNEKNSIIYDDINNYMVGILILILSVVASIYFYRLS